MENDQAKDNIPLFHIHTAAHLELSDISPELTLQGTDAVFEFPAIDQVYGMPMKYQGNPSGTSLDYVNVETALKNNFEARIMNVSLLAEMKIDVKGKDYGTKRNK